MVSSFPLSLICHSKHQSQSPLKNWRGSVYSAADPICVYHVLQCVCVPFILQDDPSVVCGAMGLCVSQQEALAKAQLMSNEIPQVDLNQRVNPFLLNIPQLLYPQEKVKETPKQVKLSHTCMFNGDSKCWTWMLCSVVSCWLKHAWIHLILYVPLLIGVLFCVQMDKDVCQDCVTFLTDTQDEAKTNASFISALLTQVESQCELLGPGMSDVVRIWELGLPGLCAQHKVTLLWCALLVWYISWYLIFPIYPILFFFNSASSTSASMAHWSFNSSCLW